MRRLWLALRGRPWFQPAFGVIAAAPYVAAFVLWVLGVGYPGWVVVANTVLVPVAIACYEVDAYRARRRPGVWVVPLPDDDPFDARPISLLRRRARRRDPDEADRREREATAASALCAAVRAVAGSPR